MGNHWVGAVAVALVIATGASVHAERGRGHGWNPDKAAGALYIMEAANASFPDTQTLVLSSVSPTTVFKIMYPYKDAGIQDTVQLLSNPSFTPANGTWLAAPVATLFGQAANATAVLLQINGNPDLDLANGTITFNVSIISQASQLKFSDGVAHETYEKAVNSTREKYAQALSVTAIVNPGAYLTNAALFLDVNESAVNPAAVPAPAPTPAPTPVPAAVVAVNNGFGSTITTLPGGGVDIVNNNGPNGGTSTFASSSQGTSITNNNGGGTPVPSTPGQTPAPGTYNVVTVTTDCNGGASTQYSYVPGLVGIQRNVNNNCG